MRYFLVDTETTGVGATDKVCEIAYLEIDSNFNQLGGDVSLINPQKPIPSGASAVNGIIDSMVANAPLLEDYLADGKLYVEDMVFIAHNSSFDFGFLKSYLHPSTQQLCTLRASRVIYPNADSHKQAALAYSLGLEIDRSTAHSAGGDLMVLRQLLQRMCADHQCAIADLIKAANAPRKINSMPFGKHKGKSLKELPKSYISWLLGEATIDDDLRASLMAI